MAAILEREIKLRFPDAETARAAVLQTGATLIRGRRLQEDALLDTADDRLRQRRCVLRVRVESGKSYLTFKGPVQPSVMKLREELETVVADGRVLIRILEELGFRVWFRYEKFREEFALDDVIIAVDETPVGTFVEIEGGDRGITEMALALGRSPSDYLVDSYRRLYALDCEARGVPPGDMLFEERYLIDHALVLAAGLGTRLRPLTDYRAKPAMPVAGEPLVRRIAAWLAAHGVRNLVINLHHRAETIAAVVGDGSDLGVRARYSWEHPIVLGSAGGPRQALPILGRDQIFIVNGDTLTDVDLAAMHASHVESGAAVTLALVPNREFHRYGGVRVDEAGRVTGFSRRGPDSEGTWHFIGVQVARLSVFASLPADRAVNTIGGVYDELIAGTPGAVRAFRCDAAFWDVGTAEFWRTSQAFSAAGVDAGRRSRIDPTARVTASVLWDDVEVGASAVVDSCIVADGVRVPDGAEYRRLILLPSGDGQHRGVTALPLDV